MTATVISQGVKYDCNLRKKGPNMTEMMIKYDCYYRKRDRPEITFP